MRTKNRQSENKTPRIAEDADTRRGRDELKANRENLCAYASLSFLLTFS